MNPGRRVILVFVKWPEPGQVKTRLAAEIGAEGAASVYRALTESVIATVEAAPADEIRVLFDPPRKEPAIRSWLQPLMSTATPVRFEAQSSGDLGTRLHAAFESAFRDGAALAAAIGTDCIEIGPTDFEKSWSALGSGTDAVFGPARDGGYYLAGLRDRQPVLFSGIPWSTDQTLPVTLRKAESAGLRIALLDPKTDIDTFADWKKIPDPLPGVPDRPG